MPKQTFEQNNFATSCLWSTSYFRRRKCMYRFRLLLNHKYLFVFLKISYMLTYFFLNFVLSVQSMTTNLHHFNNALIRTRLRPLRASCRILWKKIVFFIHLLPLELSYVTWFFFFCRIAVWERCSNPCFMIIKQGALARRFPCDWTFTATS